MKRALVPLQFPGLVVRVVQGVRGQVADLQLVKAAQEVLLRHVELAVVLEHQTQTFLLILVDQRTLY